MTTATQSHLSLLQECGLKTRDAKAFLSITQLQSPSAPEVATALGIKRTTAYATLERLIALGLVSKVRAGPTYRYSALSPNELASFIESRAQARFQRARDIGLQLKELMLANSASTPIALGSFKVSTLHSVESVYSLLRETLISGSFVGFFNPQHSLADLPARRVVGEFLQHCARTKPHIRELGVPGPRFNWYRQHIQNPHHQLRPLQTPLHYESDIIILDAAILITHYQQSKASCVKIEEPTLARSLRAIFEVLWVQAE